MNLDIRPALALILAASIPPQSFTPDPTPERTGCTAEARRETLAAMQKQVLAAVPTKLESLKQALAPGGPLEGWNLSHGTVVLESAGAVAIDNVENRRPEDPRPPLLLYGPSSSSSPEEWLDFEGPDDPYRLVGWAYFGPYTPGSQPPEMACITPEEWLVHEAGWHLKDGGMHLTPGAQVEPERPKDLEIHMWHPQIWDLHVWRGESGVPIVAFANPNARRGGKPLPDGAFFHLVDGRRFLPARRR